MHWKADIQVDRHQDLDIGVSLSEMTRKDETMEMVIHRDPTLPGFQHFGRLVSNASHPETRRGLDDPAKDSPRQPLPHVECF